MTRLAVVLNPNAGRGQAARAWPQLERELRARRLSFDLIVEPSAAAAARRLAPLPTAQAVLAVGGDGTLNGLMPALVGSGRPLGILPLGTGNDYAGMLGLKPGDYATALDRLRQRPRAVDTLWAEVGGERRPLLNGLGMGFDAQVSAKLREAPAALRGHARYLWAALQCVRDLRVSEVEVRVDGELAYSGPSCLVAAMNGARYGGGFMISPDSDPRDGCLDVVLGTRVTRIELLRLMAQVLRGTHLGDPRVRCAKGREVQIRWQRPTHAHLDGELVGEITALRAGVQPKSLLVYA